MSCYHPIVAFKDYDSGLTDNGKFRYKLNGSFHPDYVDLFPKGDVIKVPCGKCLGCRLDRSRSWADRMFLEYDACGREAVFVTLTYDPDHVPVVFDNDTGEAFGYTLNKRDVQLFMKRLRKYFSVAGRKDPIRFYSCGEYGKRTKRPHYHFILFGLSMKRDFPDFDCVGVNELGQSYFTSNILASIWKNGFVGISDVSYKTFAYVARYTMKKVLGLDVVLDGFEPEFSNMSRNPGIGATYLKKHPDLFESSHIFKNDGQTSYKMSIPKYFLDKLRLSSPELYDNLMSERRSLSHDRELLKLQQTDLSYDQVLSNEEEEKFNKTKILFKLREEV